jgi:hypothetical protein
MKIRLTFFIFFALGFSISHGQTGPISEAITTSTATSTNNAQSITFNSTTPSNTSTDARVKSTVGPMMGGFSGSFSSDYCGAITQASSGWLGFGFSFGMPKIDTGCLMLRTFERTQQAANAVSQIDPKQATKLREAALEILALIDPGVQAIFERKGLIEPAEKNNTYSRSSAFDTPIATLKTTPPFVMNSQPNAEMEMNAIKLNSVIPAAGMEKNPSKSELEKASTAIR